MSTEENKAAVLKWFEEGWNRGNIDLVDEMYTPTYVSHSLGPGFSADREGLKQFVLAWRTAMPDLHFTTEDIIAEGDKVAWRFSARGTQQGELLGIPASGKRAETTGILIARFEDEKWAEDWTSWDQLGFLQQLGAIPQPEQMES